MGIESCAPRTRRACFKIASHFLYCSEKKAPFLQRVAFSFVSLNRPKPPRSPFPPREDMLTPAMYVLHVSSAVLQKQLFLTINIVKDKFFYSLFVAVLELYH